MSRNKTYGDGCGLARALDVIGERWALLVVRDLLLGPKRYTDLQAGLPGISPNVLSSRLRELSDLGVLAQRRLPPPVAGRVYDLTDRGRELEPMMLALSRWGNRSPAPRPGGTLRHDPLVLALRAHLDAASADRIRATVQLDIDGDTFVVVARDGVVSTRRGTRPDADATLATTADILQDLLLGRRTLRDALRHREVAVHGSQAVVRRLLAEARIWLPA